jgi:DNA-binding NarL/FixJ family response regulator
LLPPPNVELPPLRVFLVDDQPLVREGLKLLLETSGRVRVAGEAGTAEEALQALRSCPCDLALLDLALPGVRGLECLQELSRRHPGLPVLTLSRHVDGPAVTRALELGASGYLPKSARPADLWRALEAVQAGEVYLHPSVAALILRPRPRACLSEREGEVLRQAARGLTSAQIGRSLYLSESTVKTHLRRLYRKLQVANRSELIFRAVSEGLLAAPPS